VDAVGGVTLNVRSRIPIGGLGSDVYDYIDPGVQKLTGFQTQWYARARTDSDDYSRMARQKCIMGAMLDQLDPSVVLRNFEKIAKASTAMVSTSIPASEVDRFMELAMKAKGQKISTLSIVPPVFDTYQPDAHLIHEKVAAAIDAAEGKAPKPSPSTSAGPAKKPTKGAAKPPAIVTGGSVGDLHDGYAANESQDLDAAC
jgi:anionic cell wall polymer biosynthesis LytR-Cps2A-Psr (LCP) family protein